MHLSLLLAILLETDSPPQQPFVVAQNTADEIPLQSGGAWGQSDRQADHATVAINEDRDILIAYHTTRSDIQNTGTGRSPFHESLKQVEIAFLKYDNQTEDWTLEDQVLIGSTDYNPLVSQFQDSVRCERPDVIAVGNRFFVVWTRRYDRDQTGQAEEPAVLECAWVEWTGTALQIYNNSQTIGRGVKLDSDYWVRECAGVPDAVLLDVNGSGEPTVGVVYPHQTEFGDIGGGAPDTRLCDLRLVVTTLDSSNQIPLPDNPVTLVSGIDFNGPTAPQGEQAAGLILPDCARALPDPSTGVYRFWLAYEEQFLPLAGTVPDGRIRLCLVEQNVTGPGWDALDVHTFGIAGSPYARRRPNLSSFPDDANGLDLVSIAFSKTNTTGNDDVVHQEWSYDSDDGLTQSITSEPVHEFENTSDHHTRPIPLHGRTSPLVRRLYLGSNESTAEILEYDVDSDDLSVKRSTSESLGRPAIAYWTELSSVPDQFVLTWEEQAQGVSYSRIWIRVF